MPHPGKLSRGDGGDLGAGAGIRRARKTPDYGDPEEVRELLGEHTAYVERTHLTSRQMNGRLVAQDPVLFQRAGDARGLLRLGRQWDGTGYPRGLKGKQIPLSARIFAVVDVWDALTSDRPYRKAWPEERVIEYIKEQSGSHFDPEVVREFLRVLLEQKGER